VREYKQQGPFFGFVRVPYILSLCPPGILFKTVLAKATPYMAINDDFVSLWFLFSAAPGRIRDSGMLVQTPSRRDKEIRARKE